MIDVRIVTPTGVVFEGKGTSFGITTPGDAFTVLPGHIRLISLIEPGTAKIERENGEIMKFSVGTGAVQVDKNHITVLVDRAESSAS